MTSKSPERARIHIRKCILYANINFLFASLEFTVESGATITCVVYGVYNVVHGIKPLTYATYVGNNQLRQKQHLNY